MTHYNTRALSRIQEKVFEDSNGCLIWTSTLSNRGRPMIWFQGRLRNVTRVVWFLHTGSWPEHTIDHTCENKLCARFEHYEDVPIAVNIQRARRPDPTKVRIRST